MNKFFRFLSIVAVAACSLVFASCSSDDDGDNSSSSSATAEAILGSWKLNKAETVSKMDDEVVDTDDSNLLGDVLTFNEDGSFKFDGETGTYKLSGNDLKVTQEIEGEKVVMAKGVDIANFLDALPGPGQGFPDFSGIKMSAVVKKFTAVVEGSKLKIDLDIDTKIHIDEMAGMFDFDDFNSFLSYRMVYDRMK